MNPVLKELHVQSADDDWICWDKQQPLLQLAEREGQHTIDDASLTYSDTEMYPPASPIRRNQYTSVMSRISQASKHAGVFNTW